MSAAIDPYIAQLTPDERAIAPRIWIYRRNGAGSKIIDPDWARRKVQNRVEDDSENAPLVQMQGRTEANDTLHRESYRNSEIRVVRASGYDSAFERDIISIAEKVLADHWPGFTIDDIGPMGRTNLNCMMARGQIAFEAKRIANASDRQIAKAIGCMAYTTVRDARAAYEELFGHKAVAPEYHDTYLSLIRGDEKIREITKQVLGFYPGLTFENIKAKSRKTRITTARQHVCYEVRRRTHLSLKEIGAAFDINFSSVAYSIRHWPERGQILNIPVIPMPEKE